MTTVYLNPVLAACLFKAEQKLGEGTWHPSNDEQTELVRQLPEFRRLIGEMPLGMMDSIGSTSAGPINEFLAAHNLDFRLPELGRDEFGTAAVLELLALWSEPGTESESMLAGKYKAVDLLGANIEVHTTADGAEIVSPHTTGVCQVCMVKADTLAAGLRAIRGQWAPSKDEFKGFRFPMVDFNAAVDVGWLVGLTYQNARLTQAFAQAKLRLNPLGAHAKAGAAIRITRSAGGPRMIVFDQPFVIAFMVAGQVALAFHVTQEDWKAPPNLGGRKGEVGNTW